MTANTNGIGFRKPLATDLYAGLGGWTEGLLAEGYRVIGFDNVRHVYGEARYPAQLVRAGADADHDDERRHQTRRGLVQCFAVVHLAAVQQQEQRTKSSLGPHGEDSL